MFSSTKFSVETPDIPRKTFKASSPPTLPIRHPLTPGSSDLAQRAYNKSLLVYAMP
jgi:hypothetical protein